MYQINLSKVINRSKLKMNEQITKNKWMLFKICILKYVYLVGANLRKKTLKMYIVHISKILNFEIVDVFEIESIVILYHKVYYYSLTF